MGALLKISVGNSFADFGKLKELLLWVVYCAAILKYSSRLETSSSYSTLKGSRISKRLEKGERIRSAGDGSELNISDIQLSIERGESLNQEGPTIPKEGLQLEQDDFTISESEEQPAPFEPL